MRARCVLRRVTLIRLVVALTEKVYLSCRGAGGGAPGGTILLWPGHSSAVVQALALGALYVSASGVPTEADSGRAMRPRFPRRRFSFAHLHALSPFWLLRVQCCTAPDQRPSARHGSPYHPGSSTLMS